MVAYIGAVGFIILGLLGFGLFLTCLEDVFKQGFRKADSEPLLWTPLLFGGCAIWASHLLGFI